MVGCVRSFANCKYSLAFQVVACGLQKIRAWQLTPDVERRSRQARTRNFTPGRQNPGQSPSRLQFTRVEFATMASEPSATSVKSGWQGAKLIPLALTLTVALILWFIPPPEGVKPGAWHLFAIFAATILGVIIKPLPMGAVTLLGLVALVLTKTVPIGRALDGFSNTTIWLIVIAFFISRGFIKTGLGTRIAYLFVAALGKRTLGLGYGLIATDLVLAPAIPSNTARAGGVVFPTLKSIAHAFDSDPGSR